MPAHRFFHTWDGRSHPSQPAWVFFCRPNKHRRRAELTRRETIAAIGRPDLAELRLRRAFTRIPTAPSRLLLAISTEKEEFHDEGILKRADKEDGQNLNALHEVDKVSYGARVGTQLKSELFSVGQNVDQNAVRRTAGPLALIHFVKIPSYAVYDRPDQRW